MKLEAELPENHNGWLIAGKNVMYGNTPMIQISRIDGFTYYEEKGAMTASGDYEKSECKWYIQFTERLQWRYRSEQEMRTDYHKIALLITGTEDDKDKIYI